MLPYTVVLKNVDPKSLHRQIQQLESLQREMAAGGSPRADTMELTVSLLHEIEEELRRQARASHTH